MPNIRKKGVWDMGNYIPTEEDMLAASWCLKNNIIVYPVVESPGCWWLEIELNGRVHRSPSKYSKLNLWITLHEFYRYYYKKYKK